MNQIKDCDCGLRDEFEKMKQEKERECQSALHECQKAAKQKDREVQDLKKKHTVMVVLVVIVATILGKETVDSVAEWIESINSVKSGIESFTSEADMAEDHHWSRS